MEHWRKWWIIYTGLMASTIVIVLGLNDIRGFPSEEYISAAAFLMLISTAILQNRSLAKQHEEVELNRKSLDRQVDALEQQIEEVKLNRKSLEIQAEEMKNHTKAFNDSNSKTEESVEQQQFYEILKLKEQLYLEIIKEVSDKDGLNKIQRFNSLVLIGLEDLNITVIKAYYSDRFFEADIDFNNFDKEEFLKFYNFVDNELKQTLKETINRNIRDMLVTGSFDKHMEKSMNKLYSYHLLIKNFIEEDKGIQGQLEEMRDQTSVEPNTIPEEILYGEEKDNSPKKVYSFLLSDDEKLLYKIIEKDISYLDIFGDAE